MRLLTSVELAMGDNGIAYGNNSIMRMIIQHEYDLIEDLTETRGAEWGKLFQSGTPQTWIRRLPDPLMVVNLQPNFHAGQWIDRVNVHGVIEVPFKDMEDDCLGDQLYLGTVAGIIAYLSNGINVLIHCQAGISRSTYVTTGVLTAIHGWQIWEATSYIASRRDGAGPNNGFFAHLKELEERLHQLGERLGM